MDINTIYNQRGRDLLYKTWHTPENNMIIFMRSDGGSIVLSNRVYEIKEGVLCFISSRSQHYTMPDDPDTYLRDKVFFTDSVLDSICAFTGSDFLKSSSVIYARIPKDRQSDVEKLFFEIENDSDRILTRACLLKLVAFLQKYTKELREQPKGFIATTVSYINTHIHEDIKIDELCKNVHMSKYHFCRKFKSITGFTVMDYILKTRITRATDMIAYSDMTIGEISEKCGFSSISYFCRVFKEAVGASPLKYRKNKK